MSEERGTSCGGESIIARFYGFRFVLNLSTISLFQALTSFYGPIHSLIPMQHLGKYHSHRSNEIIVPLRRSLVLCLGLTVSLLSPLPKVNAEPVSTTEFSLAEDLPPISFLAPDAESVPNPNTLAASVSQEGEFQNSVLLPNPSSTEASSNVGPVTFSDAPPQVQELEPLFEQASFPAQLSHLPDDLAPADTESDPSPEPEGTDPVKSIETVPEAEDSEEIAPATEEPTAEEEEEREYKYGRNGQGRWFIQAGLGVPYRPDESNVFGLAGVGITHFFATGHSINAVLNGLVFNQEGADAVGINLDVIARWHFVRQRTWSLFVDGGVGIINTTERVPLIGGSRFNFTPQVGGGVSFRVAKRRRILLGLRWHHISNANLFEPNVGQDAVYGWVGLDLPR